jgi:hypothetical protein
MIADDAQAKPHGLFQGGGNVQKRRGGWAQRIPRRSRQYNVRLTLPAGLIHAMAASHIFRILFVNQGKVYEVYARKVSHGDLFGFIEVEELVFGERTSVVLDPSEERIKGEFAGVKRTFLPLHAVLRIDEVKKQGVSKISALEAGTNVAQFPMPMFSPPPGEKK